MSLWAAAREPVRGEACRPGSSRDAMTRREHKPSSPIRSPWDARRLGRAWVVGIIWAGLAASGSRASGPSQGRTRSSVD